METKVSIITPTRNEAGNIVCFTRAIREARISCPYELVVVDDSTDNTAEVARQCGARVVRGRGLGLAQAVIDGISKSEGELIIVMDADLQHPPGLLPDIIEELAEHDLVVATKHMNGAHDDLTLWRRLQSNLGCLAARALVPISDPMSGYFGIRRECLKGVELEGIGFKIGLEIFCKANWTSHYEIPMHFRERMQGVSKGTAHSLQKHLWHLYKGSLKHRVVYPAGSEEWRVFYEGNRWQKRWKQAIAMKIRAIARQFNFQNTLDIGCGSSPNINYISGKRVGVDIREEPLVFMRKHSDATFVAGGILSIPFAKSTFDAVVCSEVLEHLYPKDIDRALGEMARVLKLGGHVIIATPNYSSKLWNFIETTQRLLQPGHWTSDHHTKLNRKLLWFLCHEHGLEEIRYDSIVHNSDMVITYQKDSYGIPCGCLEML